MARKPPAGFLSVIEAERKRDGAAYNIMAICVDYLPPAQSQGSDLVMKLHLWDPSCTSDTELGQDGMLVRCFHKSKHQFPPVHEIGDVVILYNIKTVNKGTLWMGMSNVTTKWNVLPALSLLESEEPNFADVHVREPYESTAQKSHQASCPSSSEIQYARYLMEVRDPSIYRPPPKSTALDVATIRAENGGKRLPLSRPKYRMLKDLLDPREIQGHQYVDLLGEVCHIYYSRNPVEMKITDYTENSLLYDYSRNSNELGLTGQMTINVNFWDNNADYIQALVTKSEIKAGQYVRLRNVCIKMGRDQLLLEGQLRSGSNKFGNAVTFHSPKDAESDPELRQLLSRKRNLNAQGKAEFLRIENNDGERREDEPQRVKNPQVQKPPKKTAPGESKNAKKRQRRREVNGVENIENKALTNRNVRCEAVDVSLTKVIDILNHQQQLMRQTPSGNSFALPFQNCKYKSKVKVVDFFPDKLEDFAYPCHISDFGMDSADEDTQQSGVSLQFARDNADEVKWQWHFVLMVEDAKADKSTDLQVSKTMLLNVTGQDGDYLLNMEACDLRRNPRDLAMMREKLFVLWGDLEEKKREHNMTRAQLIEANVAISLTPFECLIREYGVQAVREDGKCIPGQWERTFGLFKTNIG